MISRGLMADSDVVVEAPAVHHARRCSSRRPRRRGAPSACTASTTSGRAEVEAEAPLAPVLLHEARPARPVRCGAVARVGSPSGGISTLMTSAPSSASSRVQRGPARYWVKSRTRTPSSNRDGSGPAPSSTGPPFRCRGRRRPQARPVERGTLTPARSAGSKDAAGARFGGPRWPGQSDSGPRRAGGAPGRDGGHCGFAVGCRRGVEQGCLGALLGRCRAHRREPGLGRGEVAAGVKLHDAAGPQGGVVATSAELEDGQRRVGIASGVLRPPLCWQDVPRRPPIRHHRTRHIEVTIPATTGRRSTRPCHVVRVGRRSGPGLPLPGWLSSYYDKVVWTSTGRPRRHGIATAAIEHAVEPHARRRRSRT